MELTLLTGVAEQVLWTLIHKSNIAQCLSNGRLMDIQLCRETGKKVVVVVVVAAAAVAVIVVSAVAVVAAAVVLVAVVAATATFCCC